MVMVILNTFVHIEGGKLMYRHAVCFIFMSLQKVWMRHVPPLKEVGGPAKDMVCIVTGPTSGIGRETALELARRGAHGEYRNCFRTKLVEKG